MAITNAQLSFLTKNDYTKLYIDTLVLSQDPVLAIINREQTQGTKVVMPVIYGGLATSSANYANAKSLSDDNTVGGVQFEATPLPYYTCAQVPGQTVRATRNDKGAFLKATKMSADAGFKRWSQMQSFYAYGNGYGSLGTATFSGAVITFADPRVVSVLEAGCKLMCGADEATSALRNSGATCTILSVNRIAGTVTCTANVTAGIAAAVSGDTFFLLGDRNTGATPARSVIAGFGAWGPRSAVSGSDSFYNVNRSTDTRLVMNVVSGLGKSKVDAVIDACSAIAGQSTMAKPSHCILSVTRYGELLKELEGSKVRSEPTTVKASGDATVSFNGVKVATQFGDVEVLCSPYLSDNDGYVIQANTWTLFSNGEAPAFLSLVEGKEAWHNMEGSDALLAKQGGDVVMLCAAPCWNTRITFDV